MSTLVLIRYKEGSSVMFKISYNSLIRNQPIYSNYLCILILRWNDSSLQKK